MDEIVSNKVVWRRLFFRLYMIDLADRWHKSTIIVCYCFWWSTLNCWMKRIYRLRSWNKTKVKNKKCLNWKIWPRTEKPMKQIKATDFKKIHNLVTNICKFSFRSLNILHLFMCRTKVNFFFFKTVSAVFIAYVRLCY